MDKLGVDVENVVEKPLKIDLFWLKLADNGQVYCAQVIFMLYLYCSLLASRQKTKTNRATHNSAYTGLRTKESREATQSLAEALKTRLMTPSKSEGRTQGFYSNVVTCRKAGNGLNRGLGAYVLSV